MKEVNRLTVRWNTAYGAEEMPECTCIEDSMVTFCPYGYMEGKTVSECCNDHLEELVEVEDGS